MALRYTGPVQNRLDQYLNVIMDEDDPFVNFDDEKLEKAKRLLQNLGNRYQIVYFTCHKSRC